MLESLFDKFAGFCNFGTLTQVFSCEYFEIFKSSFLHRTPPVAGSVIYIRMTKIEDHSC